MQNQNDDDSDFSDDVYDDTLDDNFEDEFEDDDYLDEEELAAYEGFEDEGGEWDDAEENQEDDFIEENLGASVRKKKIFNIDMSFNAIVITGAIIVGLGVLVFQVVTKKPNLSIDSFISALHMDGASEGPVFGEEEVADNSLTIAPDEEANKEKTKGFLYDPDSLDSMEMELGGTPPMPSPIVSEDKQEGHSNNIVDTSLTPLPQTQKIQEEHHVPRPPEDASVADKGLFDLIDKEDVEKKVAKKLPKAEEFLKQAVKARAEKQFLSDKQDEQNSQEEPIVEHKVLDKVAATLEATPKDDPELMKPVQEVMQTKAGDVKTSDLGGEAKQKLDMILERLDDMELQITQIREAGNSKIEDISDSVDLLKKEMNSVRSASMKKEVSPSSQPSVKKKTAPNKSAASKTKVRPKKKHKADSKKIVWELRAAQPGKAWISKKGQRDMRPVVVGDSLSGIGRITAISYSGNRWVVQGTSGRILQ